MEDGGDNARRHQFLERIGAESAHGVNLLGHHHGTKLTRHSRRITPGNHQAGQHRAKLLDHGEAHQLARNCRGSKLRERRCGLKREHTAGKESREHDNWKGADADRIWPVVTHVHCHMKQRATKYIRHRVCRQDRIILN